MEPILTRYVREPNSFTLEFYLQHGGYEALKTALGKKPDEIIELVKASGLRGRGGAGFPTGMKWQFVDKKIEPRYIVCNADESEPGTFKDHLLMERNPHTCRGISSARSPTHTRRGFWGRTSSAPASTATCTCTAAPAPTKRVKKPRCSNRSKGSGRSRATSRRSRPWRACTASRAR